MRSNFKKLNAFGLDIDKAFAWAGDIPIYKIVFTEYGPVGPEQDIEMYALGENNLRGILHEWRGRGVTSTFDTKLTVYEFMLSAGKFTWIELQTVTEFD